MAAGTRSDPIKALVEQHRKRKDEPLHLAVQFGDPRHPKDVLLLEVIGGFGGGQIDPDKRFLEVAMSASSVVQLPPGGELRFVFTSPEELKEASKKNWPALKRLKAKLAKSLVAVHHADATGRALRALLLSA
jgi:hypothetical protein